MDAKTALRGSTLHANLHICIVEAPLLGGIKWT